MQKTIALALSLLLLLSACGPAESPEPAQVKTETTQQESPDDAFDRALDDLTRAFFYHSPEAATRYGVSELTVPRTSRRLMNRCAYTFRFINVVSAESEGNVYASNDVTRMNNTTSNVQNDVGFKGVRR